VVSSKGVLSTDRRCPLLRLVFGIFLVLHGFVHLLYFGQSRRLFELQPGMVWPDGSWAFSKRLGDETTRLLASISCVLAAIAFVADGAGVFLKQDWWQPLMVGSAAFSVVSYILFWDKKLQRLPDKGGIGVLVNIVMVLALLILDWPSSEF
ncbi:MAG: hypothetical protein PHV74_14735, partial [Dehalococcoidia bacterium]|nr:hypothetical protein [Dehalococcoidia bacterium]